MSDHPCVRSGLCCRSGPCAFGEWDASNKQCRHLEVVHSVPDGVVYKCGIYDLIKDRPGAEINPAFGAGCCSPLFNANRQAILRYLKGRNGCP